MVEPATAEVADEVSVVAVSAGVISRVPGWMVTAYFVADGPETDAVMA
jgi:hypothetical protein